MGKELEVLVSEILDRSKEKELFIIGISGFGGSGKSTLALALAGNLGDCNIVSMDSFSSDFTWKRDFEWSNFNRLKMLEKVIKPAIDKLWPIEYEHRPWPETNSEKIIKLDKKKYLLIEGCGIFHPEIVQLLDYKIWVDVPLAVATERGIKRDNNLYIKKLWQEIFMPNEKDFFEKYKPDKVSDFIHKNYD